MFSRLLVAYHPRGSLRCLTSILIAALKTQRNTSKPIANCQKYFWKKRSPTNIASCRAIIVGPIGTSRCRRFWRLRLGGLGLCAERRLRPEGAVGRTCKKFVIEK